MVRSFLKDHAILENIYPSFPGKLSSTVHDPFLSYSTLHVHLTIGRSNIYKLTNVVEKTKSDLNFNREIENCLVDVLFIIIQQQQQQIIITLFLIDK